MKILTKEARELREKINYIVISSIANNYDLGKIRDDTKLKVTTEIYENWYTKKGDIKRKDIANREKFLIDSIFNSLKIDDKYIFEHTFKKIQSEKEYTLIKIEVK